MNGGSEQLPLKFHRIALEENRGELLSVRRCDARGTHWGLQDPIEASEGGVGHRRARGGGVLRRERSGFELRCSSEELVSL